MTTLRVRHPIFRRHTTLRHNPRSKAGCVTASLQVRHPKHPGQRPARRGDALKGASSTHNPRSEGVRHCVSYRRGRQVTHPALTGRITASSNAEGAPPREGGGSNTESQQPPGRLRQSSHLSPRVWGATRWLQ